MVNVRRFTCFAVSAGLASAALFWPVAVPEFGGLLGFGAASGVRADEPLAERKFDTSAEAQDEPITQKTVIRTSYNRLNRKETYVIDRKGTERAGIGGYTKTKTKGLYICKKCNAALYTSESKFPSHCGWPSFDSQIAGAVAWLPDADGRRTEIVCENCGGHLGHVFKGERFTETNTRHCVNSISMKLISAGKPLPPRIVLAGTPAARAVLAAQAAEGADDSSEASVSEASNAPAAAEDSAEAETDANSAVADKATVSGSGE